MATAFDSTRPPSMDTIADCVHCGFCLPTCPTYGLWGEEMDSPRGRIVLMKEGLEEGSELSRTLVTHLDRCLGCMACVTACPSGVRYDELINDSRAQVERNFERTPRERLARRMTFEVATHPRRLRALAPFAAAAHALGLP
ncbi:MAG: 4Fe-4S dicluster domain-containing protein, partial [Actinomycetota bacterium]|nr:4Fe-4S dicluster domain-containing protein [Actinomycetota bacterium]